ncbi:hypothetical protein QE177_04395 [Arsenophonus sp. aPb]|uniref:hypothetical protein n=1 Tax=Arsenophonus sp. aPb TaxID=3041619 RepID=UPI0024682FED|nr:hypothetical protein [Arsenophonus sp. aPb]WGL99127.1 hypothetical protein QE177_04395 [Arsenophonus sp. aPb]
MIYLTKVYDDGQSETLFFNRESEAKEILKKSKAKHNKLWITGEAYKISVLSKYGFERIETISSLLIISDVISEIFSKDKKATIKITMFQED